jgi:hypothetical protein
MARPGFSALYSDKYKEKEKSQEVKPSDKPSEKNFSPSSLQSVMAMQEQLLKIYNTFSSSDFFKSSEAKDFFDYLLNKYIKRDNFGKQIESKDVSDYSKNRLTEKSEHKMVGDNRNLAQPVEEPLDLYKYISSIQYVGKHTKEGVNKPDGIWGKYTNNALINILSFAKTLFKLCKSLNIQTDYTDNDLSKFQESVPADPSKLKNKDESAKVIAENLAKVNQMLSNFISGILQYKEYIMQNKKFEAEYQNKSDISLEDKNKISQYSGEIIGQIPVNFDDKSSNLLPITIKDLSSKENFTNFLKNNKIVINGKNSWEDMQSFNTVIDSISQSLDKVLNPDSGV